MGFPKYDYSSMLLKSYFCKLRIFGTYKNIWSLGEGVFQGACGGMTKFYHWTNSEASKRTSVLQREMPGAEAMAAGNTEASVFLQIISQAVRFFGSFLFPKETIHCLYFDQSIAVIVHIVNVMRVCVGELKILSPLL